MKQIDALEPEKLKQNNTSSSKRKSPVLLIVLLVIIGYWVLFPYIGTIFSRINPCSKNPNFFLCEE